MRDLLRELDARLGPTPRAVAEAFALPAAPVWLRPPDPLAAARAHYEEVVRHGRLTLGVIFMANRMLYDEGEDDAPAGVVYSFDPALLAFPDRLGRAGQRLYALRDLPEPPTDPWLRHLVRAVDDMARPHHQRVPPELCDGHAVFASSVMVYRTHLPGGVLRETRVPLLVAPPGMEPRSALVVPGALWPDRWRARW